MYFVATMEDNRDVVRALASAPEGAALKDDREVVLIACIQNGLALRYASAKLKHDREVVLAACTQNGLALRYAYFHKGFPALSLRDDLEVVLVACSQNGRALEYASNALKVVREVVLVAC